MEKYSLYIIISLILVACLASLFLLVDLSPKQSQSKPLNVSETPKEIEIDFNSRPCNETEHIDSQVEFTGMGCGSGGKLPVFVTVTINCADEVVGGSAVQKGDGIVLSYDVKGPCVDEGECLRCMCATDLAYRLMGYNKDSDWKLTIDNTSTQLSEIPDGVGRFIHSAYCSSKTQEPADITTEFSVTPCDGLLYGSDGLTSAKWDESGDLIIYATATVNCADKVANGKADFNGNSITLKYEEVGLCVGEGLCTLCICQSNLSYTISGLNKSSPYTVELNDEMYMLTDLYGGKEKSCTVDSDCMLPMSYAIRSDCPYSVRCTDGYCDVFCPWRDLTPCTPKQKQATMCTKEYNPTCGWFNSSIKCVAYPCAETFNNPCEACSDPKVDSITLGPCPGTPMDLEPPSLVLI